MLERMADAIEALAAREPQCAVVRPLVWETSVIGKPWHSAKAPWGFYYAQWDDETEAWFASLEMGEVECPIILQPSDVPTIDDAKAAAQADYAARIMSALTIRPEEEVRAEAWAAAIEAAATLVDKSAGKTDQPILLWTGTSFGFGPMASAIRDLTPSADISAALDRIKAEAFAAGMRETARIVGALPTPSDELIAEGHEQAYHSILAAIPQAPTHIDDRAAGETDSNEVAK